jgi:hypothetical protein
MAEAMISRHAAMVFGVMAASVGVVAAGLIASRAKERASRWELLNEAVGILRSAEKTAGDVLEAVTAGEAIGDPNWRAAVAERKAELTEFLHRSVVDPAAARWVMDAITHLGLIERITDDSDFLEGDLTDWLVRLSATREQMARLKRATGAR